MTTDRQINDAVNVVHALRLRGIAETIIEEEVKKMPVGLGKQVAVAVFIAGKPLEEQERIKKAVGPTK